MKKVVRELVYDYDYDYYYYYFLLPASHQDERTRINPDLLKSATRLLSSITVNRFRKLLGDPSISLNLGSDPKPRIQRSSHVRSLSGRTVLPVHWPDRLRARTTELAPVIKKFTLSTSSLMCGWRSLAVATPHEQPMSPPRVASPSSCTAETPSTLDHAPP